ncbi:hypothetical protein M9458_020736, partial [Cirrhinus mrigala]
SFNTTGDWKSKSHVIQTRNMPVPPGSAYTVGFAPAPLYSTTHVSSQTWRGNHKTRSDFLKNRNAAFILGPSDQKSDDGRQRANRDCQRWVSGFNFIR